MIRPTLILTFGLLSATLLAAPSFARDDGGFGASFTNKAPSALTETPNSAIAQKSIVPGEVTPDGKAMQEIMPAAGDEDSSDELPADPEDLAPATPDATVKTDTTGQ